jgi:hypothetical protein
MNHCFRITAVALAASALAGCAALDKMNADHQQYLLNLDKQKCSGFGFTEGTDAFAHCMMQLSQQESAQKAAAQRQDQYNKMVAEQAEKDRQAAAAAAAQQNQQSAPRAPMSPAEKMICQDRNAATGSNDDCE